MALTSSRKGRDPRGGQPWSPITASREHWLQLSSMTVAERMSEGVPTTTEGLP
jgi:hypothetical protein